MMMILLRCLLRRLFVVVAVVATSVVIGVVATSVVIAVAAVFTSVATALIAVVAPVPAAPVGHPNLAA